MSSLDTINRFFENKNLILYGASRNSKKFGNIVLKEMSEKGYDIYPIHREETEIAGIRSYKDLDSIPKEVKAALLIIPAHETEKVLPDLKAKGITQVWIQQGAESPEAIKYCSKNNISVIHGECILMFADPVKSFHKFHRWIWKIIGKYPN